MDPVLSYVITDMPRLLPADMWVRQGLPHDPALFSYYIVLYSMIPATVLSTLHFPLSHRICSFIRELCCVVFGGAATFCGLWRLFRPTFAEHDILFTIYSVNFDTFI